MINRFCLFIYLFIYFVFKHSKCGGRTKLPVQRTITIEWKNQNIVSRTSIDICIFFKKILHCTYEIFVGFLKKVMFKFNKSHFKSQAHQFQLLRWIFSTSLLRFSLCCTRWFYLLIQYWQEPWWLLVLWEKDDPSYLDVRNQREGDSSKEILSAPAMGLKVLNELRKFLVEHVFPRLQFMRVRLAPYGRRTVWVRRCTNEDIGKEMNVISDWLLQYVRRNKRFLPSCNWTVCVPRKGRIGWTYNPMETDGEGGFFWLYEEGNNDGSKQTSASSCCVRSKGLKREYTTTTTTILTSLSMYFLWFMPQTYV